VKTTTGRDCSKKMGLQREREHKQGPQKAPTFEGEKGDKRKKKKNLFLVPNSTSNIISIL
jgi:hypothetical protein